MKLKNLIIAVIVIAILIGMKFIFFPNDSGKPMQAKGKGGAMPASVTAYIVKAENLTNDILASGTILANEDVQLQPELSGKILQLNFKEGSKVSKGDLLVKINDADFQAQYKKLEIQYSLAEETLKRQKQLLAISGISQQDFDQAQNAVNSIKADMDFATAQILKTEIKAPFNGVIGLKSVSDGAFVSPSTIIASIQQIDPVKVDFSIPERYIYFIQKGATVIFSIEGINQKFKGSVFAIEPKIDLATRTVRVRAICENSKNTIYPGAFANLTVLLDDINNAMLVPTEAIMPDISGQKVFVLKNGKAMYARVETGIRTDSKIQITKGLAVGDTVITTGIMQLKPDSFVKIINDLN